MTMNEEVGGQPFDQLVAEGEQALDIGLLGREAVGARLDDVVKPQGQPPVR